jgi:chromosome segregation ATPase
MLGIGAVAGLALLVALYAAFSAGGGARPAATDEKVAKLEVELKAANERVAKLESRLSAASADAQKLGAPGQVNVLQLSAGIRDLRDSLDMVSNDVAAVTAQVGEVRTLAGGSSKDAKMALAQIEQVGARVATINQQLAGMPRSGGAAAAGGDVQAQLKSLAQKTDKMAADIRQLYRQAGSQ